MESADQSDRQAEHLNYLSQSWIGPGTLEGGEGGGIGPLPLAEAWEDGADEPASFGVTESEVPPLSGLLLLLLLLLPLLGHSIMQSQMSEYS